MQRIPTRVLFGTLATLCIVNAAACNSSSPTEVESEGGKSNKLYVTPVQVDFGSTQTTTSMTITNPTGRAFAWSVSESAGWLVLGASSGTLWANSSRTIPLSANRGSLAAGNYKATVSVTGERGAGSETVSVSMTVPSSSSGAEAELAVSPLKVDFGSSATTSSVTLTNTGDASLSWTASESAGWLALGATSGSVPGKSSRSLSLSANRSGMTGGTYSTSVSISAGSAGSVTGSVSMTVAADPEPDPAPEPNPDDPSSVALAGRLVDQFGGHPLAGLQVRYAGVTATTDPQGAFRIPGNPTTSPSALEVSGSGYYRRQTYAKTGDSEWGMVPTAFNMSAFDDLAREYDRHTVRWVGVPTVYVDTRPEGFEAGPELDLWISQVQVQAATYVSDWTGGRIRPADVILTSRPPQDLTPGTIVIHFSENSSDYSNQAYIGMARLSWSSDGTMSAAGVWLRYKSYSGDKYAPKRQGILGHELGHAMGYGHMTTGTLSFMEPSLGSKTSLSAFDRQAAVLLYSRTPRNTSQDNDSSTGYRTIAPSGMPRFSEWVCGDGEAGLPQE
ncbi:hypothetical protein BH20GEM1_BH20GEM1_09070 [soil metagenome]